jgi:hypothetical protein
LKNGVWAAERDNRSLGIGDLDQSSGKWSVTGDRLPVQSSGFTIRWLLLIRLFFSGDRTVFSEFVSKSGGGKRFYKISFSIYRRIIFVFEIHTTRRWSAQSVVNGTRFLEWIVLASDRNIGLEIMENVLNMQVQHIKCCYIR